MLGRILVFTSCLALAAFDGATAAHGAGAKRAPQAPSIRVSTPGADAAEPAVAAAADGTVFVVWVEHHGTGADVMMARVDTAGRPKGKPVRVNPRPGEATAWFGDAPTIAVAPEGTVYVGWTRRVGSGHAAEICLSASRNGGRTFDAPVKVNDDAAHVSRGMHSLAVAAGGRVYLAWLDERNVVRPPSEPAKGGHQHEEPNRDVFVASSSDGGRTVGPNRSVAGDACPCCKTSMAVGPDARIYVSWRQVLPGSLRHIAVAASADGGATFASPAIVSDDRWKLDGCPVSGGALAFDAAGALHVVWYTEGDAGRPGLYTAASRDGGASFGPRTLVREMRAHGTPVLVDVGGTLTAIVQANDEASSRVVAAPISGGGAAASGRGFGGELPSASTLGGRVVVAFVAKAGGRRAVMLRRP